MSNYKEGEGVVRFLPKEFWLADVMSGTLQVVVVVNNDVYQVEYLELGQTNMANEIHLEAMGTDMVMKHHYTLYITDTMFYRHPIESVDVIIRREGVTIAMVPNIQVVNANG